MRYQIRREGMQEAFAQAFQWGVYHGKRVMRLSTEKKLRNSALAVAMAELDVVSKLIHDSFQYGPTYFAVQSELIDAAKDEIAKGK